MTELQILNRVLDKKSIDFLSYNNITEDFFAAYSDEYSFIMSHLEKYGCVPDKETFLDKFPDFTVLSVGESDDYLLDSIREEHTYTKLVPIVNKLAELAQSDANVAVDYLRSVIPTLEDTTKINAVDIIENADVRFQEWKERTLNPNHYFIPTGFKELDDLVSGWSRGEELVVFFARTGQGKSWVMIKSLEAANRLGYRVGLIEPEMSYSKTGYRFDTLRGNFSNYSLVHGHSLDNYELYINGLTKTRKRVPFLVSTPKDFANEVTVSKLRTYCKVNRLDILAIDGITYMTDERSKRTDNRTTELTHISEDLMTLSIELNIPVLVVVQANREGAKDGKNPELENVRDSDGISHNASLVISLMQKNVGLNMSIKKNRNGITGTDLTYAWDIDKGVFSYIPSGESDAEATENLKKEYDDPKNPYNF